MPGGMSEDRMSGDKAAMDGFYGRCLPASLRLPRLPRLSRAYLLVSRGALAGEAHAQLLLMPRMSRFAEVPRRAVSVRLRAL